MKIVIIGGSAAGMSAAAKARRTDREAEIIVFESSEIISFGACGLPYFVGDFFSDAALMQARTVEQMQKSGVDVRIGHAVRFIKTEAKQIIVENQANGEQFTQAYDKLMIATGANVIKPPFYDKAYSNVFTLTKMEDGKRLKEMATRENVKDVTIIGGGFIGIEVVEAMKKLGKHVRLIQRSGRIFNRMYDERITDLMQKELRSHDVELVLSEAVEALEGEEKVTAVRTVKRHYKTDLVVIATGFSPNTHFLESTAVERLANGAVIVNRRGETNIPDIYAAGDCATVPHMLTEKNVYVPLATGANKLGRVVGVNMAGGDALYLGTLASSCVKVLDYEAARTGISEKEAEEMGLEPVSVFITDKDQTHYYPGQEDIHVKLLYDKASKIIVGGEILGRAGAAKRIDVIAMAIKARMTTEELGMMDFCYAPPFSKTWDVLNVAGNAAK
ncbi:CoA-disulfide reductase [Sulfurovum riftiae]|uniref:CoA-disulfide reductase n=1 Tax=Sulfurovum riftiae TaxID=1630136 RepID=A0A151CE47_9BACT|nr:CoA-disulfide reductase [Sulfurovum riftiae]KYJ85523.1 CoA-disulfide reductase [Sulfurovum riftiae]